MKTLGEPFEQTWVRVRLLGPFCWVLRFEGSVQKVLFRIS